MNIYFLFKNVKKANLDCLPGGGHELLAHLDFPAIQLELLRIRVDNADGLIEVLKIPLNVLDVLLELLSCPLELLASTGVGVLQQVLPIGIQRLHGTQRILNFAVIAKEKFWN